MGTKIVQVYGCPDCGGRLRVSHGEPLPKFCSHCGAFVGSEEEKPFVPAAPMIRTALGKSADWSFRKVEADSEARAEAARPIIEQQLVAAGVPVEEAQRQSLAQANAIKVTNMRDHMNEGDVAAIPSEYRPSPVYEQQVQALGGDPRGSFAGGMGIQGAGPAPVGESGAKVLGAIQSRFGAPAAPPAPTVAGMRGGFGKVG